MRHGRRAAVASVLFAIVLGAAPVPADASGGLEIPPVAPADVVAKIGAGKTTFRWRGTHYAAAAEGALGCQRTRTRALVLPVSTRCEVIELTVDVPASYWDTHTGGVKVRISWPDAADDFDLPIVAGPNDELKSSVKSGTSAEEVFLPKASGPWLIAVEPTQVTDSAYTGSATLMTDALPARPLPRPLGPCTEAAAASMPDGKGHDHTDPNQHRFSCRMRQAYFDGLSGELAKQKDVALGEMDVARDIAAVAVTYPESGVLFFDVSNAARPRFLSWYRGANCDTLYQDVNCGAFIDLSDDAKTAFLSVQSLTDLSPKPPTGVRPRSLPGVEVLDIRDPRRPKLVQAYPVLSIGGVHTARSHVVPAGSTKGGPREPGAYLFSIANGLGIEISKITQIAGLPSLRRIARIEIQSLVEGGEFTGGIHDTFIQNDPMTGRTFLYIAGGLRSGFFVYDVTAPSKPRLLAEWDLTPECTQDWYGHTVDVATRNGHRYVTIDAEMAMLGYQSEDQADACGMYILNGDKPGPLWIVDATDLSKLGPTEPATPAATKQLKANSKRALVATWTNPAHRGGQGELRFSPHNQQIVGNRIYLSHYHGGVYVLDATDAFRGKHVRPKELGFIVPHGAETRPLYTPTVQPQAPFACQFFVDRSSVWDAYYHDGYVLAADETGGFYSLQYDGDA